MSLDNRSACLEVCASKNSTCYGWRAEFARLALARIILPGEAKQSKLASKPDDPYAPVWEIELCSLIL